MIASIRAIRLPFVAVLLFASAGMTLIAVGITFYLGFTSALENSRSLMFGRAEDLIDGLLKDIAGEIAPVHNQLNWIVGQVTSGQLVPNSPKWDLLMQALPATGGQIISAGYVDGDLNGRFYDISQKRFLSQNFNGNRFLTRERDRAAATQGIQTTPPIWIAAINRLGLSSWIAVRDRGKLQGVITMTIALSDLSRKLLDASRGSRITPFILFDGSWVLAHPNFGDWRPNIPAGRDAIGFERGNVPLPELETFRDRKLSQIWGAEIVQTRRFDQLSRTRVRFHDIDGDDRIYVSRTIAEYGARPWTVGAHFGVELFEEQSKRMRLLAILGGIVLIVGVIIGLEITRLSSRPIRRLVAAAHSIQKGDLDAVSALPRSRLREFDDASVSFNEMVEGLREKELIRGLFGKFMPEAVAEKLLADEGQLKPVATEATVFFVDLAGFTTMSENLSPQGIIDVLNDYFAAAFDIIEQHGGVITQFQGDAILAIFNVPLPDPDHPQKAVEAGIALQKMVSAQTFGGQNLSCRVGINTGEVVAANVGAPDRMNYTVHGDDVNLAARLEAMNKETGTEILISSATANRLTGIEIKPMGVLEVRGKAEKVDVFALEV